MPRFDVYGRLRLEVRRDGDRWTVWHLGLGTRRPASEITIPDGTPEDRLGDVLADLLHELGGPGREVRRLD